MIDPSLDASLSAGIVPELDVTDLDRSLAVYCDVLGFTCRFERTEERFAFLVRGDAHLMLEEAAGPGRRFRTAPLRRPFGRGVNLQITVDGMAALHRSVQRAGLPIVIPIEERWYRQEQTEIGLQQFVMADPDGYLLRFATVLGRRSAPPHRS